LVYEANFERLCLDYISKLQKEAPLWQHGRWVYFPWLSSMVHILEEEDFYTVRTARNKNLITQEEQDKFNNIVVGIAGLSIGNSVALALVIQGGAKCIKLADYDTLALSNLNRIRAGVENLGLSKVVMTAQQIYSINPYAQIEFFTKGLTKENTKGLTKENIGQFFTKLPKLDIIIDEIDNFAIKYLIRKYAKKCKIPVITGIDNGEQAIVDLERYDKDPETVFFNGRLGKVTYKSLLGLNKFEVAKLIKTYIGAENIGKRMQRSLEQMGKTIVSWPQLGGTAIINGVAIARCVRKIANRQQIKQDRIKIR
jgi:tRNA A37 threonylcarbamoyladenosine dehydratase